ncbi:F-type H+-transporting ATPase subunit b [Ruminococcaceae bacterium YRB3002]|nr:F-type H+-transporting ATPase subunit b [Ruminococcaceae bacterium YRB3002]
MQTLDIISVNIWQIIISLCNLVIIFLIMKKFLFKPVKDMIAKREAKVNEVLDEAKQERAEAEKTKTLWEEKMAASDEEADRIIKKAVAKAGKRSELIIGNANSKADEIVRQAKAEAELEHKAAEESIRHEIVTLSSALTGKLLEREINPDDHSELIDEFINEIGEIS